MSGEAGFDREFVLGELIAARDADELCTQLTPVLGAPVALLDAAGAPFGAAAEPPGAIRAPLVLELEPLAYLACACDAAALKAAARVVRWGLLSRARFRMVSDLHLEAVRADYAKLQQQNEALRASEAKYRELAEALDAKVKEQVRIIDERQRQLYQAERLASIGQLAAGVAHEINNPLGFVTSNLSSAERYVAQLAALRDYVPAERWKAVDMDFVLADFSELIADSQQGVTRIARIVRDLKGFSSVDKPDVQLANLNEHLESLFAVIAGQKPAGVTLHSELGPLPPLTCLPGHLNQAFLNMLQNALQAVDQHGSVTLRSSATDTHIVVQIDDDGPGIAAEVLPHIFDPFYTTRGVGGGTGLGLTVARDIVLTHGGTITAENRPDGGARFTVELPL
ncbi:sensor histidine kinase [Aromatoleum petrolei]|uniref:histidine kinase n=1 Tax=Aromatoleum petrolei TaxID=76116 RepID=A0ABX1MLD6_9RHOO|nr:ATP-binding protein [Aromatoleum petrolei]NMF86924.1 two-component sensor histidine kinase [Aromatoleum petrolei]QTQ37517.1 Putative two component system histidine kinase [Aromatoleum petrolei]